jgi:hypothetical protein
MPKKRTKLKSAKDAPKKKPAQIHDRRAEDLPFNARIAVIEVDDAYGIQEGAVFDKLRREWVSPGQPKVQVVRNLRDDPLAAMRAADQVNDVQARAGEHWQFAYLRCEIGGVKAIDPAKEAVDGGRLSDPLSEVQQRAIKDITRARQDLGLWGDGLIRDVLGRGMTIAKAADARGLGNEYGRKYLGKRFRECLDTLAVTFGYATHRSAA